MTIRIYRRSRRGVNIAAVRRSMVIVLRSLGLPNRSVLELTLADDSEVKGLHARHFGLNTRTNVVSFGLWRGSPHRVRSQIGKQSRGIPVPLGDVVISVQRAEAEARRAGYSTHRRVLELAVHGILHLLGYEHEHGGRPAREMRKWETRLLRSMGDILCTGTI